MRTAIRTALALAVGAIFLVVSAGAASAGHSAEMTPKTNLKDKQVVTVTWSGAEPNSSVGIFQCRSTKNANGECEIRPGFPATSAFTSDANGSGSTQFEVHQNYDGNGACQTTCYLKVNQPGHDPVAAVVEFTFAAQQTTTTTTVAQTTTTTTAGGGSVTTTIGKAAVGGTQAAQPGDTQLADTGLSSTAMLTIVGVVFVALGTALAVKYRRRDGQASGCI